jgi:hypothetical protein
VSARWPLGWWGWFDQGQYFRSAAALSRFDLRPESHWYPLGYPALGAILYPIVPTHAFLIPNVLCFLGIIWLLNRIYLQFLGRTEAAVLIALSVLWTNEVMENLVLPWNTIPTHLLTYAIVYLMVFGPLTNRRYLASGFFAGLIFSARPGDVLFVAPVFAATFYSERQPQRIVGGLGATLLGFVPPFGATLALNAMMFGSYLNTPYAEAQVAGNGFSCAFRRK